MVNESAVQAKTEGYPTDTSQTNEVARQIDPLEPISLLKLAEAALLLFPIGEVRVHEMRDAPISAGSDRLRDKSICWSFVPMPNHRDYMH